MLRHLLLTSLFLLFLIVINGTGDDTASSPQHALLMSGGDVAFMYDNEDAATTTQLVKRDAPATALTTTATTATATRMRVQKRRKQMRHKFSSAHRLDMLAAAANACRKVDFHVNFLELGWEKWIIYPKIFNAFACGGSCSVMPIRSIMAHARSSPSSSRVMQGSVVGGIGVQVTNHAQIMSLLEFRRNSHQGTGTNDNSSSSSSNSNSQIMSKCVSTKLKPLSVIFLNEYGEIKTKTYDDMVVEECGCR